MRFVFGCLSLLFFLNGCGGMKSSISYYESNQAMPASPLHGANFVVLNNGLVEEYPRTSFDKAFGKESNVTELICTQLTSIIPDLEKDHVAKIEDPKQVAKMKHALRVYFGQEVGQEHDHPGSLPLNLPGDMKEMDGPLWLITDWEFQVSSHVDFNSVNQAPGGQVLPNQNYSYFTIQVFGITVDKQRKVTRYTSSIARGKYNATAKTLPLEGLLRSAVKDLVKQMSGSSPKEVLPYPRSLYRR